MTGGSGQVQLPVSAGCAKVGRREEPVKEQRFFHMLLPPERNGIFVLCPGGGRNGKQQYGRNEKENEKVFHLGKTSVDEKR
jgi:hypothetical protein